MRTLRIATRASALALVQARQVAAALQEKLGCGTELLPISTRGDRLAGPLAGAGGKGLFAAEVEGALLAGRADLAVHSAKDLPAALTPGLVLAAAPRRADPRDALVARPGALSGAQPGARLAALAPGARIGTGSPRRAAQLRALRPDLAIAPLRGNVGTRLRRLDEGRFDALLLACAGLDRLGQAGRIAERLAPEQMLPAAGQGALAVEARAGEPLAGELRAIEDSASRACLRAERAFLAEIAGDCHTPIAALAELSPGGLRLRGLLASPDGAQLARAECSAPLAESAAAGRRLARELLAGEGAAIVAALRGAPS
ncbi:MAG: hydroxymethylbilane synthase [Deltaproteobacteria bacterium]|nr:hydroxymethylbilane synthase [Deltaproteobacteria bacterium]